MHAPCRAQHAACSVCLHLVGPRTGTTNGGETERGLKSRQREAGKRQTGRGMGEKGAGILEEKIMTGKWKQQHFEYGGAFWYGGLVHMEILHFWFHDWSGGIWIGT